MLGINQYGEDGEDGRWGRWMGGEWVLTSKSDTQRLINSPPFIIHDTTWMRGKTCVEAFAGGEEAGYVFTAETVSLCQQTII